MKNVELIAFRKGLNKSIPEMAKIIGVSASYYEKVEYGQRTPSYNFIRKFKDKYPKCNSDVIFFSPTTTHDV